MNATAMLFMRVIPDWNSLESVRQAHSDLEAIALVFFALLVLFDVLAHFSDDKNRERLFEKIALCLFAIAVFAEIAAYPYGQRNDTLSETEIAVLRKQAADAGKKAAEADREAGQANEQAAANEKEAAGLRKDAEAEHLKRVKIEAAVAWRLLDDKQKKQFGEDLAGFSSRAGASIWFNGSSTEAEMFADDIAEALRYGHIITNAPGGMLEMRESSGKWNERLKSANTGVIIQSTRESPAPDFADAVIKELLIFGFDAKRQTDPPFEEKQKGPIVWINVEPRPKGPQGEYKLQAEREAQSKARSQR